MKGDIACKKCYSLYFSTHSHHAWTSFQASAEIYNELQRVTENANTRALQKFLCETQMGIALGMSLRLQRYSCWLLHFMKKIAVTDVDLMDDNIQDTLSECANKSEIHRKIVAHAFWNGKVEMELRERGWEDYRFMISEDRERLMERVDRECATTVYAHKRCSELCKKRGSVFVCNNYMQYVRINA